MKKQCLPLVAALATLAATTVCCNNTPQAPQDQGFTIIGQLHGEFEADSVWLFLHDAQEAMAAGRAENGAFRLEGEISEPSLGYILTRDGTLCDLIVEGGQISLKQTGPTVNDILITGTPANDAVTRDFAKLTEQFKSVPCEDTQRHQELIVELWMEGAKANSNNYCGVLYTTNLMDRIPKNQLKSLYNALSKEMKATQGAAMVRSYLEN